VIRQPRQAAVLTAAAALAFAGLFAWEYLRWLDLQDTRSLSGWALLAVMAGLLAFRPRKTLAMLPLGSAAAWKRLHLALGGLAVGVYALHVPWLWPQGAYERAIALLFLGTTLSGIAGWLAQRFYPAHLNTWGREYIYERIPAELARLRRQAEEALVAAAEASGSDALVRHHAETMAWFFRRPRFLRNHMYGGRLSERWVRQQYALVYRYLGDAEKPFHATLRQLALEKCAVDAHYAVQSVLKLWLFVHLPLTGALAVLAVWHVVLVHVYVL